MDNPLFIAAIFAQFTRSEVLSILLSGFFLWIVGYYCWRAGIEHVRMQMRAREVFVREKEDEAKDGGALAMRTYVQNRDEHRVAMAARVTFA